MRPQRYRNLEGSDSNGDKVPWYWRVVAGLATLMILGGYLMLPATFDSDPLLRAPKTVIGIFAVALLTAGLSVTGLVCFAVRNAVFQAEAVFLPCTTACALGLLTVFYDFLISTRYAWNTPALLVTVAAAVSTVVYGALLIYTYRRIPSSRASTPYIPPNMRSQPLDPAVPQGRSASLAYQAPGYYENYLANMYPTSTHPATPFTAAGTGGQGVYDPNSITEEEMQRQQMLMLLLQRNQPPTPDPSQSTFHIDWQGQAEADEPTTGHLTPVGGYYPPRHQQSSASARSAHSRQWSQQGMRPWDGVWRGVSTASGSSGEGVGRVLGGREEREERRREIEMSGRL